jgi:hypothetical protein
MAFLRRHHETDPHEPDGAPQAPDALDVPEPPNVREPHLEEVEAPDEAQGRQDWFAEFLGDRWEPVGDGTYRLVRESWEPLRPSGPYGVSLVDDLSPGAGSNEQSEKIEGHSPRSPEGS